MSENKEKLELLKTLLEKVSEISHNSEFNYTDGYELEDALGNKGVTVEGFHIEQHDDFGGEGMGDTMWKVFSVTSEDETFYFKLKGYYDSWNGTDWDGDIKIVEPREITVIVWDAV